ncbi:MAG TPA: hypothetical protein VMB34_07820 [Acetobacteraceae bacterium]|nr:hypothetical protein [Acetobacteraceae bacterium]
MKAEVLAAIGETGLSRSAAVNTALAANDRIKYLLSLLQMAAAHADAPEQAPPPLKRERIACGIDDASLDGFTAAAARQNSAYHLPGVARLLTHIGQDLVVMAAPVLETDPGDFASRVETALAVMPAAEGDLLAAETLDAMGSATPPQGSDSLHRLVMDLHKRLNALQASLAEEAIDGAAAYGLAEIDRPRVAAFMAGVNRTAPLKFDHPGLATTATRSGETLVLQNDIGTTDAHVVVIHVETLAIRVTYTDVHPDRLRFFQDMLAPQSPTWETSQPGQIAGGSAFTLAAGRIDAPDEAALQAALTFIGSRLVFLIDWNRARKQFREFLPGAARIALLHWAAAEEVGHRAFLELGGAHLVNQAIEAADGSAMHFGDRLSDVLGVAETEQFLRFVLRAATDCLLARRSPSLLRDRIRAELGRHFSNERRRLLRLAADHAGLIFELASLVRDGMLEAATADPERSQHRARRLEHDADRMVAAAFEAVHRRPDHAAFGPLLHDADDAADELEEAVFLIGLLAEAGPSDAAAHERQALAALLLEASQEWLKALLHAAHAEDRSAAEDADDFLVAIDRIAALEHAADDAERALTAAAVRQAADFRHLHLCAALGARLEAAADALKRASLTLRDTLLREVLGG